MEREYPADNYRRRSPDIDRRHSTRSERRRSRSPGDETRHQHGGHGRDHRRDDRRRPPSPGLVDRYVPGQTSKPTLKVNPMPDPLTLDFQVGYNWFGDWWRAEQAIKAEKDGRKPSHSGIKGEKETREDREKEKAELQIAFDAYKEEFRIKSLKLFVKLHRNEQWFREKYESKLSEPFKQRLFSFRRNALTRWQDDLSAGKFDEFTLEGIYKTESNGMGGTVEREEGETVAAAEVLSVGDLVPSRGGDIQDDSNTQPALLIKTLAPFVSREKLESLCRETLGEQDGGFQWLSLSDANPSKKCHRIGWIMLNPQTEVEQKVERGDGRDEDYEKDEGMEVEPKSESSTAEKAQQSIDGKTLEDEAKGTFTCHVGVHVPPQELKKKALWDLFSAPERVARDLELAKRVVAKYDSNFGSDVDGLAQIDEKVGMLRANGALRPASTELHAQPNDAMEADVPEDGEEGEEPTAQTDEETDDEDLLLQKKTLDLLVEYLRRVHNFCLFCVFESDSIHELTRKCASGHLRRPRASLSTSAKEVAKASASGSSYPAPKTDGKGVEDDQDKTESTYTNGKVVVGKASNKTEQQLFRAFNWIRSYEEKILQILEPENIDLKKIGGTPIEDGVDQELQDFVKQEDENKFRCKVPECTKLFKGDVFWRKHVEKRHAEFYEEIRQNLTLLNAYVLDPAHVTPSRNEFSSNGQYQGQNNMMMAPGGPARGFNPHGMPHGFAPHFNPAFGGVAPPYAAFGNHMVHAPQGGWPMMQNGAEGMHHGGGPMRRGGRFGGPNRMAGPYDRRNQHPRYANGAMANGTNPGGMMMGAPSGPSMHRRGGGFAGPSDGSSRWGDGVGAQAMGPREAVQGRTIKKYDDLDAVGAGQASELDY